MNALISAKNLPRMVALAAALAMVAAGILLSRSQPSSSREATIAERHLEAAPLASPEPSAADEDESAASPPAASQNLPGEQKPAAKAEPQNPSDTITAPPKPLPAERRPAAPGSLPPFLPPLYGPDVKEEMTGPPPGVLWLSGVIQGKPKLAVLRRGENRYLVREGETVEDRYRVTAISADSVTLQQGSRRQTLRLGQY